jgi:diguanylate cyclase (GGDEF)-like protein/PAS domain S-box-containing protein
MKISRLLGKLSVSRKLLLIYLLDLTAVIFITSILIEEKFIAIDFARKELQGNTYIASVRDNLFEIVSLHDHHRGDDAAATAPTDEIRRALAAAEQTHGQGMNSARQAEDLISALGQLNNTHATTPTDPTHFAFQAGRALLSRIGDQSNLILDPDLDSYYTMSLTVLRFPDLLDQLLHYTNLNTTGNQRELLFTKARLEALHEAIAADYRAAVDGNISGNLGRQLEPTRTHLLDRLSLLVQTESTDATPLALRRAEVLVALHEAWAATATNLDALVEARVHRLFQRMWLHLGMAALLLAIILFLVFFVARLIAVPLRRLAEVADRVQASNDYTLRARWTSQDEIGQLVTGFNTMLERLDQERLLQQELVAKASAAEAQTALLEAVPIPLLVTAIPDHRLLHVNTPARDWVDTESPDPWASGMERGARARFFQRLADEGEAHEFEARWHGPRGPSWALLSATRLRYRDQDAILTTFTPINTIKRMEARLRLWASVFESTSEGILVLDTDGRILLANAAILRTTGYRPEEMVGRDPEFLHAVRTESGTQHHCFAAATSQGAWQGEYWLKHKNGNEVPHWLMINRVRDEQGEHSHSIALFVDIAERKAQEEQIRHLAHHDPLTGLPNRLLFDERLKMSLQQAARHSERVALLFIDLDRFKAINDSLGHHIGDGLLQSVSQRLVESVRAGDTVCRQGGDEFVVILNAVVDAQEVAQIVGQRLIPLVLKPHPVDNTTLNISCSVGIALYPDDGKDMDSLMRNADAAMYAAKANGRNNFQFFSAETNREALEKLAMENALRDAIANNELELHVQPMISLEDRRITGVEALLRWHHPTLGQVPPVKFIPIAEDSGLIHGIGAWVIDEACRLHRRWLDTGLGAVMIAVNVSPAQFRREDFIPGLLKALDKYGLQPGCLQLELTESLMMSDSDLALEQLRKLKAMGFSLSLDDFGTGYSSLSYLQRYPFDKLKIDRSFVRDMVADPVDLAITRTIASLGKTLGMRVIAEGVEHPEEQSLLGPLGCDEVQGYLISRPLPSLEFETWVREFEAERD